MRHLGVDFKARQPGRSAKAKRAAWLPGPVRAGRMLVAKKRALRIARLEKVAPRARKLFHTGILPSLMFGGEVTGTDPVTIKAWRAMVTRAHGHPNCSKDVFGALFPGVDPLPVIAAQPLARFAEEVWRASDGKQDNGGSFPWAPCMWHGGLQKLGRMQADFPRVP